MPVTFLAARTPLILAALLPAAVLLWQVYRLDRIEKEPGRLLALLFAAGAGLGLVASILEAVLIGLLHRTMPFGAARLIIENFLLVGLLEEGCKLLPVRLIAWKSPAFNYRFDAVVYCVFAALGFAALENVMYVWQYGFLTALSRALLAVPGHFFFAVYMGIALGEAKQAQIQRKRWPLELTGDERGAMRQALLVPALLHGFWDFSLSSGSRVLSAAFYVFVLAFFAAASMKLRSAAQGDSPLL